MKRIVKIMIAFALVLTICLAAVPTQAVLAAEESAQISAGSEVTAPQISLKNVFSGIKISWNKVSGAEGYNVYRKGQYDTEWICVDNTKSSEYLDTFPTRRYGQTFAYKVCIASSDGKSIKGTFSPVKTLVSLRKPTISGFKVANAKAGIKLNVYTYSTNGNGFIVYRKGPDEAAFTRIAKISEKSGMYYTYTDTELTEGKYSYKVCYYKGSSKSAVSEVRALCTEAPSLKVRKTANTTKLSWNAAAGANRYQIYWSDTGSSYKCIADTDETAYVIKGYPEDYMYGSYKVRPYFKDTGRTYFGPFSAAQAAEK